MQQRGTNMEAVEDVEQTTTPPSRGRSTSKLKVLGRSHAMREEQSPPREPVHGDNQGAGGLQSPPTVVLSPSPQDEDASSVTSGATSSATQVASLTPRCSPQCDNGTYERLHPAEAELPPSPKYLNGKNGTTVLHKSSQAGSKNGNSRRYCECQSQNCIKCVKDRGGTYNNVNNNTLLRPTNNRGKLRQQSSSQTSFESSAGTSPSLSRDNSADYYTDTTGVDLEQFIPDTINRNPKDRALMLRIEEELINLVNDKFQTHYKFPPMTSYHRMLVHRCAAYFGMDHNIDQSGKCIVVNKTKNTRLPDVRFKEHVKEMFNDDPPRRSILKRDSNSIEDYCFKSPERGFGLEGRRSKSFEEREEEYERARRRIFRENMHDSTEDFGAWSDVQWSSSDSEYSRYRLQPPEFQSRQLRRLLKVHSEETEQSMRPCVAKSYSFGGYGGGVSILTRGDSVISTHSAPGSRPLIKQDSGASSVSWRLSPSSSGYKSQSQMSESVTPSPTSTPHLSGDDHKGVNPVVWAVTDLSNVPKGSVIINPETGKPYKNEDGTIYYYDPGKPAPGLVPPEAHPVKIERAQSPTTEKTPLGSPKHEKKSPSKCKSSFTNTATSPSLPFSPPLSTASSNVALNRSYSYLQAAGSCESVSAQYQNFANPQADGTVPLFSQPYVVYTTAPPYGVQVQQQFDGRLEAPTMSEISATTYYVPEGAPASATPTIAYQSQPPGPYWNQTAVSFYPSAAQPPQAAAQRFSVQVQPTQGQTAYVPATAYPVNYVAAQQAPSQPPNAEVVPVYPNQQVQMVYQAAQANGTAVVYQNQPLIYTHNPTALFQSAYTTQPMPAYPPGVPTPNGTVPSMPSTPFEQTVPNGYVQLTQSMQQMSLNQSQSSTPRGFVPVNPKCAQPFDPRRGSLSKPPPGNYGGKQQRFFMNSSQSSTGTNSPAATVVAAGYCPSMPPPGQYHTPPPSTPPTPQYLFNQHPNFPVPPRLYRQMSGERGPTPGTAKSSRSPTPAGDQTHCERQRFTFYPGMPMPYIVQSDPRFVGRGQPNVYRQPTPPMAAQNRPVTAQGFDNRFHNNKNRKSRYTASPSKFVMRK